MLPNEKHFVAQKILEAQHIAVTAKVQIDTGVKKTCEEPKRKEKNQRGLAGFTGYKQKVVDVHVICFFVLALSFAIHVPSLGNRIGQWRGC